MGAQGRLPQNLPPWHIDYFKLKLLEKQPVQERQFDLPLSPLRPGNKSPGEGVSLYQEAKKSHPCHQRQGLQDQEACVNKPCYSLLITTQAQTLLQFLTN